MKDFFRSRFFTVLVIITLVMVIVPSVFGALGIGNTLKNMVNTVFTPVQKLFSYVTDAADGFVSYFTEFDRIVEENNALREENARLKDEISSAKEIEKTNDWLFTYLELKKQHSDYSFCEATVTGRESGNYMTVFTLDKGTAHGVEKNMPVVMPEGVVGYIIDAGTSWSKAVTMLESGSSIGAYVERSGVIGVVEGTYDLAGEGLCEMKYLSADADIAVGDRIMTSGFGSVYPRGLVVGYVEEIAPDAASRGLKVKIKPSVDIADVSDFMIITDYETYSK